MIANNENGRASATNAVTPPVVIATAGRGAVNHYLNDSEYLAGLEADCPLVCPCNSELWPCEDCRTEIDAAMVRVRASLVERFRDAEGLDMDADGGLLCTTCGIYITRGARLHCATCSC